MTRIAFVTCGHIPSLTDDDRLAAAALEARAARVEAVDWADADADWSGFDRVVVRSPWDYWDHGQRFLAWIDRLEAEGMRLLNPPEVLRWNVDKGYLLELAAAGVAVVPTHRVPRGSRGELRALLESRGWNAAVLKPSVSAGARRTVRVTLETATEHQPLLDDILGDADALLQPFVPEVVSEGEWSLIYVDGAFSHAVVKRARDGDFRVQERHGGTVIAATPPDALLRDAEEVLARAPAPTLYARVDGCDVGGRLQLMELEVIEPELFFRVDAAAPARFAEAVLAACSGTFRPSRRT